MMKSLLTTFLFAACALSASATDYYVSPAGAGTKDGSSWENAWDLATFQDRASESNSGTSFANDDNIYFAGGKYVATKTLYIKMGLNLIGATEGERTVFSGDANGDGEVNEGDRDRVFQINTAVGVGTTEKCVSISNIDFDGLFIAQGGDDTKGAIYLDNCGALVTVSKCNFKNLINTGQGANAFFSKRSSLKVIDCTFTGNKAANRGVVARLQSNNATKGWTTFERCLFADNEATGSPSDPCGLVMMQHGQELTINSCTFVNNTIKGNGASIYNATKPDATYARVLNVTNCLFYNNTSADNQNVLGNSVSTVTNSVVHDDATSAAINITSVGVGTYYLGLPFTMPAGLMGKTFSSDNAGVLTIGETYTAGDIVPAGTALLVEGTEGVYDPVVAVSDEAAPTNLLKGSDVAETTTGDGKHYKLANGESGLGFYYAEAGGAAFMNKAHRAYLVLDGSEARSFVSFENEAASVKGLQNSGTKRSGKFIENGRIVMMKNGIKYNVVGQKL